VLAKSVPRWRQAGDDPDSRRARHHAAVVERLEARALLSITSVVESSGLLRVTAGAHPDTGPFPSAGVTAIEVVAGPPTAPGSNVIDFGAVTPADFTALTRVSVDGGGDNRLIGPDLAVTWGLTAPDTGILTGPALGSITS
jgi:hypothetical protein